MKRLDLLLAVVGGLFLLIIVVKVVMALVSTVFAIILALVALAVLGTVLDRIRTGSAAKRRQHATF